MRFTRRSLLASASVGTLAPWMASAAQTPNLIELRFLHMKNSSENQMQRTREFLESATPILERIGVGTPSFFTPVIAPDAPFILSLASFPNGAAMESARSRESADKNFLALAHRYASGGPGYVRSETMLLRCFESIPAVEVPPADPHRPARIFELRMYESPTNATLARKIKMFNDAEIGVFRRLGMQPVFFGEMLVGPKMPNLVYMLAFDDLAAREKLWRAFGSDPEWQKLRAQPGLSDAEIVANISNMILSPLPFSRVR